MRKAFIAILMLVSLAANAQTDNCLVITQLKLEGNKTTKPSTIYRELLFKEGDTISKDAFDDVMKKSRENLLNTSAFNFVDFELSDDSLVKNGKNLKIIMTERWYIWPFPYLRYADRNVMSWLKGGDVSRLSYGVELECNNLWGRLHNLKFALILGFNQKYGLTYDIPYLTNDQNIGLEVSAGFARDREVAYATVNDKVMYFKTTKGCPHQAFCAYVKPYYRFGYRNRLFLTVQYDDRFFSDTLVALNPTFGNGQNSRFQYFTLSMVFKNDYRDDNNYPLDGHYLELEATKIGLGLLKNEPKVFYGKVTADFYTPIAGRFYWASNITAKVSPNNSVPYFLNKGLGYDNDYVRTNDLYVVNAMNFAIVKNNLKFAILNPVTKRIPFIKNDRFGKIHLALYANLFFDLACSWNVIIPEGSVSKLANKWNFGTGVGVDFVTYYDKVLRLEYGVNGLGEWGFFIHFVAPI